MRPIESAPLYVYVPVGVPIGYRNIGVPEAAVLSYPVTVPVVVPWILIAWRSPGPVLTTVVVAVEM